MNYYSLQERIIRITEKTFFNGFHSLNDYLMKLFPSEQILL